MKNFLRRCVVALGLLVPTWAFAQQVPCVPTDKIQQLLFESYGERLIEQGITSSGQLLQIYTNADNQTFTAVIVFPDGRACLATAGQDWEQIPSKPMGKDS